MEAAPTMIERLRRSPLGAQPGEQLDAQSTIRRRHLRRALELIAADPGRCTRASIARDSQFTSATASSLVAELIQLGLVAESAPLASTGGKRATGLALDPDGFVICVVLVRPREVRIALISLDGRWLGSSAIPASGRLDAADVAAAAATATRDYAGRILATCIQSPGVTDGRTVVESVLMGWHGEPLADVVEAAIGAPVFVLNDADGEALNESAFDESRRVQRLFVRLGEGVGGAVTVDGVVVPGAHQRAGEIGHVRIVFDEDAPRCKCGATGCVEAVASLSAMLGEDYHDELDFEEIAELAGRPGADARLGAGAYALARLLRILAAMLDPHEVVLGGAGPALGDAFLARVLAAFDANPAKGTGGAGIRYARARSMHERLVGPARHALSSTLGVPLILPAPEDPGAPEDSAAPEG
ncbi:ROK family protein [Agromyces mediolanus]|uniref:ROK family protein n=1 Tax=Agromyces mediolanus TaxID=41986 RepID=UPI0038388274